MGDQDRAIEYGQQALAIADAVGEFALRLRANTYLGQTYYALGEYRRAAGFLRGNIDSLDGERMLQTFGFAQFRRCTRGRVWCGVSRSSASSTRVFGSGAKRFGSPSRRIIRSRSPRRTPASAPCTSGKAISKPGLPILERGLDLCRTWKLSLWFPPIASALGIGYMQSGRVADALSLLERAVEQSEGMRLGGWHSRVLTGLGLSYLLAGRAGDALLAIRRALDLAREHKERGHEAWSWRHPGEIPLRSELELPEAEEALNRALQLATELEMRPLMAHSRLGLGRWYARVGRRADAEPHLHAAVALFGELEMRFWATQAESALTSLH
jgi:tetratricopeptide (TPR) repeat protein